MLVVVAAAMLGLCACKKRTPFFCFVHKRPVCEGACLAGPGGLVSLSNPHGALYAPTPRYAGNTSHVNCVVKTYNEWIADADYDWCGHVLLLSRVLCRDMIAWLSGRPVRCSACYKKITDGRCRPGLTALPPLISHAVVQTRTSHSDSCANAYITRSVCRRACRKRSQVTSCL